MCSGGSPLETIRRCYHLSPRQLKLRQDSLEEVYHHGDRDKELRHDQRTLGADMKCCPHDEQDEEASDNKYNAMQRQRKVPGEATSGEKCCGDNDGNPATERQDKYAAK